MRVIGAMAMRLGTVRPLITAGRDRMAAARAAVSEAVTVTWGLLIGGYRLVCAYASNAPPTPTGMRRKTFRRPAVTRV
ncbi:hypothetical protein GCM10010451_22830 [Streptomyces virens]|uniref:Uncharacterized protein n=1 Tax=Streptomyces virens TaxID=285572 RepID=A0ABP6PDH3_9ACTN